MNIQDIEGIGAVYAEILRKAGLKTANALLKKGGSVKGREELAAATGLPLSKILEWVNHADLCRVRGIGAEYSELLEAAGVDTVVELSRRNAENLTESLAQHNANKHNVRRKPSLQQVTKWIQHARSLPRAVEY